MAILLVEIGLDEKASAVALALPPPLTFVMSPYSDADRRWYSAARWVGHETLLELPIRPLRFPIDENGPLSFGPEDAATSPLDVVLARGIGYLGVFAAAGQFKTQPASFGPIAASLANRGLALVEIGSPVLESPAQRHGLPYLNVPGTIDEEPSGEAIDRALTALEDRAAEQGFAAGCGRPFGITIDRLAHWMAGLSSRGVTMVSVGELLETTAEGKGSSP